MTFRLPLTAFLLSTALVACDADQLSVQDELTLAAIGGEEEDVTGGESDLAAGESNRRPLFRECDAERALQNVMDTYDDDQDGQVGGPAEEAQVREDQEDGRGMARRRAQRWERLAFIYDADDSGDLDEAERATLLDDFTARCEAIHARILEEFDADGDGELSEAEREVVRETMEANRAERAEQCSREDRGSGGAMGEPPARGPSSATPPSPEDRMLGEFDVDGDGALSDPELADLRAVVRDRIRSGVGPRPLSPRDVDEVD